MGDAGEETWALESVFHFVVNATNFERSLDFYTTLGFQVLRSVQFDHQLRVRAVGIDDIASPRNLPLPFPSTESSIS